MNEAFKEYTRAQTRDKPSIIAQLDSFNLGESRSREKSSSINYTKLGRELMTRAELDQLDGDKSIVQISGVRPFLSEKFDLESHPNFKLISNYSEKRKLNVEKYLNRHLSVKSINEIDILGEYEIFDNSITV